MNSVLQEQIQEALDEARENDGILSLVPAGAPVLREEAERFDGQVSDADLAELVTAMEKTMRAAPGVGLAAPQVGIGLRLFVAEDPVPHALDDARERVPFPLRAYLNAEYADEGTERVSFYEGCLSIPGYQAVVERSRRILLRSQGIDGVSIEEELLGWPARIAAHETDHLDGVLYLDRAQLRSLASDEAVAALWSDPSPDTAADILGFELAQGAGWTPGQIL